MSRYSSNECLKSLPQLKYHICQQGTSPEKYHVSREHRLGSIHSPLTIYPRKVSIRKQCFAGYQKCRKTDETRRKTEQKEQKSSLKPLHRYLWAKTSFWDTKYRSNPRKFGILFLDKIPMDTEERIASRISVEIRLNSSKLKHFPAPRGIWQAGFDV